MKKAVNSEKNRVKAAEGTDAGRADIEGRHIEINGQRVYYRKAGNGRPVVLLHGGASDSRDWLPTMSALADRFNFYAPDIIGFGQSDRNESGYYLSDFSDFLKGFIEALKLEKPSLVGHSFGARVCLDVALHNQERINKLVLVDASGLDKISTVGSALFSAFTLLRNLLNRPQPFPRFLAKEGEDYNRVSDAVLRGLNTPTLLVWKRYDPYLPVAIARRAEKVIPGARLVVIPGYGHAPNKQNRDVFNQLMVEFLDGT
jgi:pimeloyl-ACP methyl ester carboxylesterase